MAMMRYIVSIVLSALLFVACSSKDTGKTVYRVETVRGQAVAIDDAHGLMWQRDVDWKPYNFDERDKVLAYCDSLEYGGFTDWKVPTIDELRTMIVGCHSRDKCRLSSNCLDLMKCWTFEECQCVGEGPGKQGYYLDEELWLNGKTYEEVMQAYFWTSNLWENPDRIEGRIGQDEPYYSSDILVVNFREGKIGDAIMDSGNHKFVRCVRNLK